jgi:hypothetical protein
MSEATHPHLQLARTVVSVPNMEPGAQVFWHCDTIHAVESVHGGTVDSSVFYIPAVPLTDYKCVPTVSPQAHHANVLPAPNTSATNA